MKGRTSKQLAGAAFFGDLRRVYACMAYARVFGMSE